MRARSRLRTLTVTPLLSISLFSAALGIGGLGFFVAGAAPAVADPAGSLIAVVVDRLTPLAPQPGETLRISGKLLNTSDVAINRVSARLGVSASPVEERAQITKQANLELDPEIEPVDYFLNKTKVAISDTLKPGDEADFEIAVPLNDLPLGRDGVYTLMVEVLGASGDTRVRSPRRDSHFPPLDGF